MVSSLQNQLEASTSLNAGLLDQNTKSRRQKKPHRSKKRGGGGTESYLFTAKDAAGQDFETVRAIGANGLLALRSISPETFGVFLEHSGNTEEDSASFSLLFSTRSKDVDRTLMTIEEANQLNIAIQAFLRRLGPFLLDPPAGKALEWLVRRFR